MTALIKPKDPTLSLQTLLSSDLIECSNCGSIAQDAHTLPCLHSYCIGCLPRSRTYLQERGDVVLPGSQTLRKGSAREAHETSVNDSLVSAGSINVKRSSDDEMDGNVSDVSGEPSTEVRSRDNLNVSSPHTHVGKGESSKTVLALSIDQSESADGSSLLNQSASAETSGNTASQEGLNQKTDSQLEVLFRCLKCKANEEFSASEVKPNPFIDNLAKLKQLKSKEGTSAQGNTNTGGAATINKKNAPLCDYCAYDASSTYGGGPSSHAYADNAPRPESLTPAATAVCLACSDRLCSTCATHHRKAKMTRSHHVVPIAAVHKGDHDAEVRGGQEAWCRRHDGGALRLRCAGCDGPACNQCLSEGARGIPQGRCDGSKDVRAGNHSMCGGGGRPKEASEVSRVVRRKLDEFVTAAEERASAYGGYARYCATRQRQADMHASATRAAIQAQAETLHKVVDDATHFFNLRLERAAREDREARDQRRTAAHDYANGATEMRAAARALARHAKDTELSVLSEMVNPALRYASEKLQEWAPEIPETLPDEDSGNALMKARPTTNSNSQKSGVKQSAAKATLLLHGAMNNADANVLIARCFGSLVPPPEPHLSETDRSTLTCLHEIMMSSESAGGLSTSSGNGFLEVPELMAEFECLAAGDEKTLWPSGLAVSKKGDIIVCDRENRKIKMFSEEGKLIMQTEGEGDDYSLQCPFDVAATNDGRIIVTDYGRERVLVFSAEGKGLASLGPFSYPRGVAVAPALTQRGTDVKESMEEEIFILDSDLGRVTVHSATTYAMRLVIDGHQTGGGPGFTDPYYLSVTPGGRGGVGSRLIVTDLASPHVHEFDRSTGRHIGSHTRSGARPDEMLRPHGVCVDAWGSIIIADNENHKVVAFSSRGAGRFERVLLDRKVTPECERQDSEAKRELEWKSRQHGIEAQNKLTPKVKGGKSVSGGSIEQLEGQKENSSEKTPQGSNNIKTKEKGGGNHTTLLWHPMTLALTQAGNLVVAEGLGKIKIFKYREYGPSC